jgi:hypothetical protein
MFQVIEKNNRNEEGGILKDSSHEIRDEWFGKNGTIGKATE